MKVMLNSNNKYFLEMYEPEIEFLDDYFIVESPEDVNYFLEEFNTSIDELKRIGLKAMKNKITIPKGTKATLLKFNADEFRRTKISINSFEFLIFVTYEGDFCMVEAKALDPELEKIGQLYSNKTPSYRDNDLLYGQPIGKLVSAFSNARDGNTRYAFEDLKCTPRHDALNILNRYFIAEEYDKMFDEFE